MVQRVLAAVRFRPPMICRRVYELPEGDAWQYELKLDGYRAQAIKSEGQVRLYSRRGHDFEERFPHVLGNLRAIRGVRQFILNGELVAIDEEGRHSFHLMQRQRRTAWRVVDCPVMGESGARSFLPSDPATALPQDGQIPSLAYTLRLQLVQITNTLGVYLSETGLEH